MALTYLTRHGNIVTDPLGVQLVAVPRNVAVLGATWKPLEKLRTYAEMRYIGTMLLDTTSNAGTLRYGQGGNTVVNASASYAVNGSTDLFLSAVNLFNHRYSENSYTFNQPYNRTLSQPLSCSIGLKLRF